MITMAKFRPKKQRKNLIVLITMSAFAVLGITFLIIGFGSEALVWMRTFGLVIIALVSPIIVYIVFKMLNRKVEGM